MIKVEKVSRRNDQSCNSCAYYRKLNYAELTFYRVIYSVDEQSRYVVTMCNECLEELRAQIAAIEES